MTSTTVLNLNLQRPNYAVTMHAVQNDKMSRKITAFLYDGDAPFTPAVGAVGVVRCHKPDGTECFYDVLEDESTPAVTWDGNEATVWLAEQAITVAGNVLCQVQFYTGTERLTTFSFIINVQENAVTDEDIVSSDYFSVLTQRIEDLLSAVIYPPEINELNHWVLFDPETQQYYDSGVDATGVEGPTGPAGPYMASIAKVSGTSAPGTTDQYQVTLSDGTHPTGTITVYNGEDGQGSPGSATPLMDGNATAGVAQAYSREDHVHPTDTSRASATDLSTLQNSVNDLQGDVSGLQGDVADIEQAIGATVQIEKGGTGATTAAGARTNLNLDVTSSSVTTTYGIVYGRKIPGLKLCCVSIVGNSTYIPTGDSNVPHTFPYPPAQETNIALGKAVYVTISSTGAMSWHNATGSQQRYCSGSSAFITAS